MAWARQYALDRGPVGGAEGLGDRRAYLVVERPGEQPALPLEALDEFGGQRVEHGGRVGHPGRTALGGRLEAGEHQQAGELQRVAQLVVHAHRLVRRPLGGRVHAVGVPPPGREGLLVAHQAVGQPPQDGAGRGRLVQTEAAHQQRAVLGDGRPQRVPVDTRPLRRVGDGRDAQDRRPAGEQLDAGKCRLGQWS